MDSTQSLVPQVRFALLRVLVPYRLPLAVSGCAALLLLLSYVCHLSSVAAFRSAQADGARLLQANQSVRTVTASQSRVNLQTFRSSHLLSILEQGASAANIKLDEISFAIEDSPSQPFVRYRASFTVFSRYPTIHKFISEILAGSEGVVLDTVTCRREDVSVADVRCDISAYVAYQEKAGG